jgi:hypothetical protein
VGKVDRRAIDQNAVDFSMRDAARLENVFDRGPFVQGARDQRFTALLEKEVEIAVKPESDCKRLKSQSASNKKAQIPRSRQISASKSTMHPRGLPLNSRNLEFSWDLELGFWDFFYGRLGLSMP